MTTIVYRRNSSLSLGVRGYSQKSCQLVLEVGQDGYVPQSVVFWLRTRPTPKSRLNGEVVGPGI